MWQKNKLLTKRRQVLLDSTMEIYHKNGHTVWSPAHAVTSNIYLFFPQSFSSTFVKKKTVLIHLSAVISLINNLIRE